MKAVSELPMGYKEILSVNLQKDKKLAFMINAMGFLVILLMAIPMHFVVPFD